MLVNISKHYITPPNLHIPSQVSDRMNTQHLISPHESLTQSLLDKGPHVVKTTLLVLQLQTSSLFFNITLLEESMLFFTFPFSITKSFPVATIAPILIHSSHIPTIDKQKS